MKTHGFVPTIDWALRLVRQSADRPTNIQHRPHHESIYSGWPTASKAFTASAKEFLKHFGQTPEEALDEFQNSCVSMVRIVGKNRSMLVDEQAGFDPELDYMVLEAPAPTEHQGDDDLRNRTLVLGVPKEGMMVIKEVRTPTFELLGAYAEHRRGKNSGDDTCTAYFPSHDLFRTMAQNRPVTAERLEMLAKKIGFENAEDFVRTVVQPQNSLLQPPMNSQEFTHIFRHETNEVEYFLKANMHNRMIVDIDTTFPIEEFIHKLPDVDMLLQFYEDLGGLIGINQVGNYTDEQGNIHLSTLTLQKDVGEALDSVMHELVHGLRVCRKLNPSADKFQNKQDYVEAEGFEEACASIGEFMVLQYVRAFDGIDNDTRNKIQNGLRKQLQGKYGEKFQEFQDACHTFCEKHGLELKTNFSLDFVKMAFRQESTEELDKFRKRYEGLQSSAYPIGVTYLTAWTTWWDLEVGERTREVLLAELNSTSHIGSLLLEDGIFRIDRIADGKILYVENETMALLVEQNKCVFSSDTSSFYRVVENCLHYLVPEDIGGNETIGYQVDYNYEHGQNRYTVTWHCEPNGKVWYIHFMRN